MALGTLADVDQILLVADASSPDPESEKMLINALGSTQTKAVLALNKIDLIKKPALLSQIETWHATHPFEAVVPISARQGDQVDALVAAMEAA